MIIDKPWAFEDAQYVTIQNRQYNVHAAISLSAKLEQIEVPIKLINRAVSAPCDDRLMDFVSHVKAVNEADLSYPILISEFGAIIDGRHRLAKAMLEGRDTILCRQFEKDPPACYSEV